MTPDTTQRRYLDRLRHEQRLKTAGEVVAGIIIFGMFLVMGIGWMEAIGG